MLLNDDPLRLCYPPFFHFLSPNGRTTMKWQNSAASRLRQRQNRTFATRASAAAGSSAAAAAVAAFGGGTGGGRGGGGGRKRKAARRRGESNRVRYYGGSKTGCTGPIPSFMASSWSLHFVFYVSQRASCNLVSSDHRRQMRPTHLDGQFLTILSQPSISFKKPWWLPAGG